MLVPFILVLGIGLLLAKVAAPVSQVANRYGSVEMAAGLGVLLIIAVLGVPVYWAVRLYRYLQYLCHLGWNDAHNSPIA